MATSFSDNIASAIYEKQIEEIYYYTLSARKREWWW